MMELTTDEQPRHHLPPQLIHELRTPLNQIIGYSEMLAEQAREGGQDDFVLDLEKLRKAGLRLLEIISDNFDAALAPVQGPLDVAQVTEQLTPTTEFTAVGPAIEPATYTEGRLLVVDDNEGNRDVLTRRLEKQGYTVVNAENGRQALEILGAATYDMVLLDIMMPELDGYEVLKRIKADEHLRHIPVIMISALSEMESVARCIEMGADDYLPKPFNAVLLKARIGASLEKKRLRDREVHLFEQLQQNYEHLQRLQRLRDDLTNMIVHDLRTPLGSVITGMQTVGLLGTLTNKQQEMMDIALKGGQTLLGMINDLLDVEKLESGSMELEYSMVSSDALIEAAVGQVATLAEGKQLVLRQHIAADLPQLLGDEHKLCRTLVNLLGNAIKFTPPGGTVTVGARQIEESIQFSVTDTGEGIPADAFDRIFEKFGQVESREGGRHMSTGLGLTFCKLTVETHDGHIGVKSTPGQGSTFCFTIPLSPTF